MRKKPVHRIHQPMTKTRRNLTFRPYYTLLIRDHFSDEWQMHFGDYNQSVVDQERDDMRESGYLKKNLRIIRTAARRAAIEQAVEALNRAPFDPPFRIVNLDNTIEVHNAIADAVGESALKPDH